MYISINTVIFPNVKRGRLCNDDVLFSGQSLDLAEVEGEIVTYRNDGFELRRDDPADYLRVVVEAGRILLTNTPEPEPEPEESIGE